MEEAKRDMDTIAQLGGTRIAAPPAGPPRDKPVDLDRAAERYHALLELGRTMGVTPQVEMWGGNTTIGTLSKAIYVAVKSGHPDACFLGDVYHIFKGGSDFDGLKLLGPSALQTFHMNDYPAEPPRAEMRASRRSRTSCKAFSMSAPPRCSISNCSTKPTGPNRSTRSRAPDWRK